LNINQSVGAVVDSLPIFIVGAGGIVRDAHLPAYRKAGFTVVGICDLDRGKAEALQSSFPEAGKVYDSLDSFLQSHGRETIVYDIAVPASSIISVLKKLPDGVPVLIQKPMGEDVQDATAILQLCEQKSLTAAVNFQLRYAPFSLAAKSLVDQEVIGDIYDVEIMVCVYTPWHLWKFLEEKPRVEILYHSIHYLDLVRSFLGNPARVYASTVKHPHVKQLASTRSTIILDFDAYKQARIITNHGHNFGIEQQNSYLKLEGTRGAIQIQMGVSLNYPKGLPDRLQFISDKTDGKWRELALSGSWFPDAFIGPMSQVQRLFNERGHDKLEVLRDNFETMRLVEAAYRSSESGGVLLSDISVPH
jgi:predicted dehydrogenase